MGHFQDDKKKTLDLSGRDIILYNVYMSINNNKGFSEILRMVIIISFISVIYMTGIYVWQYIEAQKRLSFVVGQLNKMIEENTHKRQDSINFGFNSQGGCANIYLYNFNKDRSSSMSVEIDVRELGLIGKQKKYYDVASDSIKIKLYQGSFLGHLHCNEELSPDLLDYEEFVAQSGQVSVVLDDYNFVDKYIEDYDYQATVALKDIIFVDNNGEEIYIGKYLFDSVEVGWLPET